MKVDLTVEEIRMLAEALRLILNLYRHVERDNSHLEETDANVLQTTER